MKISRILDNNYYQISGWMINRLHLKGVSLSAYAIIYGFTQDGENEFTGSLQYLCDFCGGVSKPTIIKALKELTEKGYIIRREEIINKVMFTRYKVNLQVVKNLNGGSKDSSENDVKNLYGGSKESLPNNNVYNKSSDIQIKYNTIINHLNVTAHTKFKAKSKTTQSHIKARFDEGFTVDDFITVIDKKCAEWIGTDFEQYLRPSTLFGTKFEGYLNAPLKTKKTYGANGIEIKTDVEEIDDLSEVFK